MWKIRRLRTLTALLVLSSYAAGFACLAHGQVQLVPPAANPRSTGNPASRPTATASEAAQQAIEHGEAVDSNNLGAIKVALLPRVVPGAVWRDRSGNVIQAHGGSVLKQGSSWYWFGEDRSQDLSPGTRAIHVYESRDLMTWDDRGRALELSEPEVYRKPFGTDWQMERPKVYKVSSGNAPYRYVMYVHLDAGYKAAEVGVAGSQEITGPYKLLRHFRPLGLESRDIGQFVDGEGSNYLIFESRPTRGFFIAKLSEDGLSVAEQTAFVPAPLEGGAIVQVKDRYFCIGSHMTGWKANPDVYATALSLAGPWSAFHDIAPPETDTYGGQSANLLKVEGVGGKSTVLFIGDIWKPEALWDSRYLWMPLEVQGDKLTLPAPRPWRIDVRTGTVTAVLDEKAAAPESVVGK